MTEHDQTADSHFLQDAVTDMLYEQALAFVQANHDATCATLQRHLFSHLRIGHNLALQLQKRLMENGVPEGIENYLEPKKVFARVVDLADSPTYALIELIACEALGNQHLATTSASMPRGAAETISRLYAKVDDILPSFQNAKAVLGRAGQTSWATAASSATDAASTAASKACAGIKAQGVDLNTVSTIMVITTMTPDGRFIDVIKKVLNSVRSQLQPGARMATAVVIDYALKEQVQVQLLVTGL